MRHFIGAESIQFQYGFDKCLKRMSWQGKILEMFPYQNVKVAKQAYVDIKPQSCTGKSLCKLKDFIWGGSVTFTDLCRRLPRKLQFCSHLVVRREVICLSPTETCQETSNLYITFNTETATGKTCDSFTNFDNILWAIWIQSYKQQQNKRGKPQINKTNIKQMIKIGARIILGIYIAEHSSM